VQLKPRNTDERSGRPTCENTSSCEHVGGRIWSNENVWLVDGKWSVVVEGRSRGGELDGDEEDDETGSGRTRHMTETEDDC